MPNLWDRPPIPKIGDPSEDVTYAHVGRLISQWEFLEFALSQIYSCFCVGLTQTTYMREYGSGNIFRVRADILKRKAEDYFVKNPDQGVESEFDRLLTEAKGYSERRNDIAHGVLFPIHEITLFRERIKPDRLHRPHYAIIPPLYASRFHKAGLPDFAYTSVEMGRLTTRTHRLTQRLVTFRSAVGEEEQPQGQP